MHGIMIQISNEEIPEEDYINEDKLESWIETEFDYIYGTKLNEEGRKSIINNLVKNTLPRDMLEPVGKDVIRYKGGMDKWKKKFVSEIKKRANEVNEENCMLWFGELASLKHYLEDPFDINYRFFIEGEIEKSYGLMDYINNFEPGTLFYIGGILMYHF